MRNATYRSWESMVRRTTNPKHVAFERYSALGIDPRWLHYSNFLADLGERPGAGYSIERIDNEKGYFPGNCRWATSAEQQRNQRGNRFLTVAGVRLTAREWGLRTGLGHSTILERLRRGWTDEEALSTTMAKHRRRRKRPTHCKHGHAFTAENTYVTRDGRWSCRTCLRKGGYPCRG